MTTDAGTCEPGHRTLLSADTVRTDMETWTAWCGLVRACAEPELGSRTERGTASADDRDPAPVYWLQTVTSPELPEPGIYYVHWGPPQIVEDAVSREASAEVSEGGTARETDAADVIEDTRQALGALAASDRDDEGDERLGESIRSLIYVHGRRAVCEIDHQIHAGEFAPDVIDFTLRVLGDMDHPETHGYRQWALKKALLGSSSPVIRDSANVGLALMDDPGAIPAIREAIEKETSPLVSKLLNKTLRQLEETAEGASLPAQGEA